MSVKLNPSNQLGFNRPFTQVVQRKLTITNHNSQPVGFEVKTTAPEFYTAIPNSGVIKPGDSVDVQVLLMAMREDPPLSHKCKDKFLVESMIIPPNRLPKSIYDMVHYPFTMRNLREDQKRPEIHQQKIKVVYLLPEEEVLEEEDSPQKIEAAYLPSEEQPPLCIRACPITMGDIVRYSVCLLKLKSLLSK
ncbi:phosphatidylinositol-binding protein scs2 [Ceratobasidium sp. 414]|nr:phosphatidylinositol-binding protein scs2 [Ceratobasidium sp. 414]